MKIFFIVFFSILAYEGYCQHLVTGEYYDYFGSKLVLNCDSTFKYTFQVDVPLNWQTGRWKAQHDTIYFTVQTIWDTIKIKDSVTNSIHDSLVLSIDDKSNSGLDSASLYKDKKDELFSLAVFQMNDSESGLTRLFFRRNKLFPINSDGTLYKQKDIPFLGNKKYHRWFIKRQIKKSENE